MENNEFFLTFTLAFWSYMYLFDKTETSSFLWSVIAGTNNKRSTQIAKQ